MNPTIAVNLLTNQASSDHGANQLPCHHHRAPELASELILQASASYHRANYRQAAGMAEHGEAPRQIDLLEIEAVAYRFEHTITVVQEYPAWAPRIHPRDPGELRLLPRGRTDDKTEMGVWVSSLSIGGTGCSGPTAFELRRIFRDWKCEIATRDDGPSDKAVLSPRSAMDRSRRSARGHALAGCRAWPPPHHRAIRPCPAGRPHPAEFWRTWRTACSPRRAPSTMAERAGCSRRRSVESR
jgi:hypothetical protein